MNDYPPMPATATPKPSTALLIAAAGSGTRLGRGPKAFLKLHGRTLLERVVTAVREAVDEVLVAVPEPDVDRASRLLPGVRLLPGGSTRQETVSTLAAMSRAELVLVHDVARPFLALSVVERVLAAAMRARAATATLPIVDTVVDNVAGQVVERDRLRIVQTPQGFDRELLLEAHRQAARKRLAATDDASLVRELGVVVELVRGSPWLLKVTEPDHLALAEAMAAAWDSR